MRVLTVDDINEVLSRVGPRAHKASLYACNWLPCDKALSFHAVDGEIFTIAHHDFWARAFVNAEQDFTICPSQPGMMRSYGGVPLIDIDHNPTDARRVYQAVAAAMLATNVGNYWPAAIKAMLDSDSPSMRP